ncbi:MULTISPECIES: YppG family protein [Bacillaceae]|uniref:YppG family protein n=1 Tax=Bacillaceae TaxID=186817 RepID=UPI001C57246B|nr:MULTISPECIES: YppG family protein [Rossellomorea]MBW3113275.1 YppG family protein [Bacillus sp. MCCB 382]MDX8343876.1 YppG family protein [Rossellomorea sp. YZS02]
MNSSPYSRQVRYQPYPYYHSPPANMGPMMNYPVQGMRPPNYGPYQANYLPQPDGPYSGAGGQMNQYQQMNQSQQMNPYFENPLQQKEYNPYQMKAMEQQNYANPYPKASFMAKPSSGGVSGIMNSFKSQDGSLDFNKMMNTTGQMMGAINQVSSLVKGLGGIFKF